jgi:hypothetical protein
MITSNGYTEPSLRFIRFIHPNFIRGAVDRVPPWIDGQHRPVLAFRCCTIEMRTSFVEAPSEPWRVSLVGLIISHAASKYRKLLAIGHTPGARNS